MSESLGATRSHSTAFGAALRSMRLAAGLSQGALAERAGLSEKAIGALERGDRTTPRPATVVLLAQAVGASPAERERLLAAAHAEERPNERGRPTDTGAASLAQHGLLVPPTPLLGRQQDIAAVSQLVSPSGNAARLVTLIGPGGVGKTRVALAVALDLVDAFAGDVWFVDLSPLRDYRLVAASVARALDVRESGGRSALELLVDALRERLALLVLDNFEHVVDAAPLVADLVSRCPRLSILVTSRSALRLRAERRLAIEPLLVPRADGPRALESLMSSPAVQLFVDRAQAIVPDFEVTPSMGDALGAICRQLDGLPLAIELAAAQAPVLSPEALSRRLERPFRVLSAGTHDLPTRQQTLHNTLAWSYHLLGPAGQALFRRLAVFVGGWTLDAAEVVCADLQLPSAELLDGLRMLLDSSLLRLVKTGDGPRFGMLETLREYAREELVQSGELQLMRAAHAAYYSALAEPVAATRTIAPWTTGPSSASTDEDIDRLEAEYDNLEAALDWWVSERRPAEGLRLAVAFYALLSRRGQYGVARRWLQTMLDLADRTASGSSFGLGERAVALAAAGTLAGYQGDNDQARDFHRRSVEAWRELGHPQGLCIALANLGLAEWVVGHVDPAITLVEEALVRSRAANVPHTVAVSLRDLGLIARSQGDYARAEALFSEAAEHPLPAGWFRAYSIARSISCMGRVAYLRQDLSRARHLLRQAFDVIRQAGVTGHALADCLDWQAALESQTGDAVRAVRLFGAADTHWRTSAAHRYLPDETSYSYDLAQAQVMLDADAFSRAWADGAAMQPEQAIACAVRETTPPK